MYADEGIGVHFINFISKNYSFASDTNTIEFLDGGTMAAHLIPIIAEFDYLILVDCIDADDANIGDVYFFDYEDMPKSVNWSGSAHEVEMLETLQMMDLVGDRPQTKIIGIIPKRIKPMEFSISQNCKNSLPLMEKILLKELKNLNFSYQKTNDYSIEDIIKIWEKEQF